MTPAIFDALVSAYNSKQKLEDRRSAVLTLVVRQAVGDKKAELWDYFPEHQEKKKKRGPERSLGELLATRAKK